MIPFSATQNTRSPLFTDLQARPADTPASAISSGSNSTISSNDFLTLLVTEMKNQDPTSATDPNQYVNQLVSVNSLEQLIEINQTLSGAMYSGAGAATGTTAAPSGNLSLPPANPAAQQIARALSPHPRA
jgi:flagellar basal-body rod modification protein FlgD